MGVEIIVRGGRELDGRWLVVGSWWLGVKLRR